MKFWIPRQRKGLRIQTVVKAIIFDEKGRFLLMRKPESEWRRATKGYDLPGGKIEERDQGDIVTALWREVREETGLEEDHLDLIQSTPSSIEEEERPEQNRILHIEKYPCVITSPAKVQLSGEHEYGHWLTLDHLKNIKNATKFSWLLINPQSIGCPPDMNVKDWIEQWKDVPDQMIRDIEIAHRYWQKWMDRQQLKAETGRER